jgi:tRNA G37 N-methylase TrmD
MWRRKHNLLANPQAGKALEIREFLYHQGLSDMEIAILLKCDNSAIRKWRYKHNLVSTVSNRPKRTREEIMYARIKTKLEVLDVDSREISGGTVED